MNTWKQIVAGMGIALMLACCGGHAAAEPGAGGPTWTEHKDPLGFSVRLPQGWKVETTASGRILFHSADRTVFALIQPFLLRKPQQAEDWLQSEPARFTTVFPEAHVEASRQVGAQPDAAIAKLRYRTSDGQDGQAGLLCAIQNTSGILYAIAAPKASYAAKKPLLLQVLESVHFEAPSGGTKTVHNAVKPASTPGEPEYVAWTDPQQGAFHMQVPRGWKVTGGMFQLSALDFRPQVEIVSPDGQIHIQLGDKRVPIFAEPTQTLQRTGFPEGSRYSPGGTQEMVLRYHTGLTFAKEYVQQMLTKGGTGLEFKQERDLADLERTLNAQNARLSDNFTQITNSVGETAFTFTEGGQLRSGYCLANTCRRYNSVAPIWQVADLLVFVTTPEKAPLAGSILQHIIRTVAVDPDWSAKVLKMSVDVSKIILKTHEEISRGITDSYWRRQHAEEDQFRRMDNVINGETDLVNPADGTTYKTDAGANYYWQRGGTLIGTKTYSPPGVGVSPLKEW